MAVGVKNPTILRGNEAGRDWVAVAALISEWTRLESNLITQSATTIYEQLCAGRNIVVFDTGNGDLVGFLTVYRLTEDPTWELGSVIVDPTRRGQGWGHLLYTEVPRLHEEIGGTIYSTTKTSAVKHMGPTVGLLETDFRKAPETSHRPLCQNASCFQQVEGEAPGVCSQEHRRGGPCVLQRRTLS